MNTQAITLGCALLALSLAGTAHAWPAVALPEQSRGELVSAHMNNNGLDMRVSRFTTSRSREEVLEFYRRQWGEAVVENDVGPKTVLGHARKAHFITVEVEPAGAYTQGTIAIAREPDPHAPPFVPGEGVDRPAGTEVHSDIRFYDTPNDSRVLVLNNTLTPFVNLHYFSTRFRPSGWTVSGSDRCLSHASTCTAEFERGDDGARMTLTLRRTRHSGTQIVMLFQ